MEQVQCPACMSAGGRSTGQEAPGFTVNAGKARYVQDPYSVCECVNCGLLYKTQTLSDEEFLDYYRQAEYQRWESSKFYPTERAVLRRLHLLPKGAKIFDFGCSSGRLLAPLVGFYRCFGHEINEDAKREAEAKGIITLSREQLQADEEGESYDAVVMADVFEHLPCPVELLRMITRLLKKGGRLILVTGNGDAPLCRIEPAHFWYFRIIEHVAMLTEFHAKWLEENLALRLVEWKRVCHYDANWSEMAKQGLQIFAYWRVRFGTRAERMLLRRLPGFRKALNWPVAPAYCYTADHVIAVFEK